MASGTLFDGLKRENHRATSSTELGVGPECRWNGTPRRIRMRLHPGIYALLLLLTAAAAWSQTESGQQPGDIVQSSTPDSTTNTDEASNSDQTATSQIDHSSAVPPEAPSSFFMADIVGIQGAESNTGLTNATGWSAYSRALGGLHFLKVHHRFETAVDYRGGELFQDTADLSPHRQIQELNATQLVQWKTGELTLADSLSNYAGGSFGSPWFGGASLYGLTAGGTGAGIPSLPGTANLFGVTSVGGIGQGEHFTNISVAGVSQFVSQRSMLSAEGGYGITNFFDQKQNLINSSQISGSVYYSYELSRKSEFGLAYSYRTFTFPNDIGSVVTNRAELTYIRRVSRRLSFQMGAGPELEKISERVTFDVLGSPVPLVTKTNATNVAGFGSLSYRFRRADLGMSYSRGVMSGSGFYAAAQSDVGLLSLSWRLFRAWNVTSTAGYAKLSPVGQSPALSLARSYQSWFAGLAVGRELSKHWGVYASYQYNNESFASTVCAASVCDHVMRNAALIGFRWHTRPYRLDHGDGKDMKIHSLSDRQDTTKTPEEF